MSVLSIHSKAFTFSCRFILYIKKKSEVSQVKVKVHQHLPEITKKDFSDFMHVYSSKIYV